MTDTLLVNIAAYKHLKSPNPSEYNGRYLFIKLYDFSRLQLLSLNASPPLLISSVSLCALSGIAHACVHGHARAHTQ